MSASSLLEARYERAIPAGPPAPAGRLRLAFLDGMRGLAAAYVVLYHCYALVDSHWSGGGLSPLVHRLAHALMYGRYAVGIFIVLSGFCLMLPVARSTDGRLHGGVAGFMRRRARRILPPYYAAMALSLLLVLGTAALRHALHKPAGPWRAAFSARALLTHLLLVHNLLPDTIYRIDGPMWSVGTEWQIYLIFALALLPIQRRWGMAACIAVAFAIGLAPHFLLHGSIDLCVPWYTGLFALGMAAAVIAVREQQPGRSARLPWGAVCAATAAVMIGCVLRRPNFWLHHMILADATLGFATACFILACARSVLPGISSAGLRAPLARRLLEARPLMRLGAFSYSLYLVHLPLLMLLNVPLVALHLRPDARLFVLLLAAAPTAACTAYLFYRAFEAPFARA